MQLRTSQMRYIELLHSIPSARSDCVSLGTWIGFSTSSLAKRIILRRHPFNRKIPFYLPILPLLFAKALDTCRIIVSNLQSDFRLVCTSELLHCIRKYTRELLRLFLLISSIPSPFSVMHWKIPDSISESGYVSWIRSWTTFTLECLFYVSWYRWVIDRKGKGFMTSSSIKCLVICLFRSKRAYTLAMVGFAFITIYMTVCSYPISFQLHFSNKKKHSFPLSSWPSRVLMVSRKNKASLEYTTYSAIMSSVILLFLY